MVGLAAPPYLISRAVDQGLQRRDLGALAAWAGAVTAVSLLSAGVAALRHRAVTHLRMDASLRCVQLVSRKIASLGTALPTRLTSGEVVNISATDIEVISQAMTIAGPGLGALAAYAVVAVLLCAVSPLLAVVVLLGVPSITALVTPQLRRMRRAEERYRQQQGLLTVRAGDIVSGLRVLCGIGGKERFAHRYDQHSEAVRHEGYRLAAVSSWVQALAKGMPGLFLVGVIWLSARMAAAGDITIGQMTAVYGYTAVLTVPVSFLIDTGYKLTRGLVAAGRITALLALPRPAPGAQPVTAVPDAQADLTDLPTGLQITGGALTAVVSDRPSEALALLERLAGLRLGAQWDGICLMALPASQRRRVLLADHDAYLFAGTLHTVLATQPHHDSAAIKAAAYTAAADDLVEGHGLDTRIEADGRNLSGGQRQRLRLVRALLADADILLLAEPSSAVDAHTEALIAARLQAARRERTTVVTTTSALLLDQADHVACLRDGRLKSLGTHRQLLADDPWYRALVMHDVPLAQNRRTP
ncbi:ABC transporter transmembrane domain-containing protein [Streptomyces sp. NPDC056061]|uniref:ABC transporter transmembrane domain-containing protein n=1 Tax=Streptomyces sp. NPDC056061 TaxID=3345700 RepID=UPI0035DB616A